MRFSNEVRDKSGASAGGEGEEREGAAALAYDCKRAGCHVGGLGVQGT